MLMTYEMSVITSYHPRGFKTLDTPTLVIVKDSGSILFRATHWKYVGQLKCSKCTSAASTLKVTSVLRQTLIAAGAPSTPQIVDMNDFHCAHSHVHEDLPRKTTKQLGVQLTVGLHPCRECSEATGLRRPIQYRRTRESACVVFVGLVGPKPVLSLAGKWYAMIARDDYSRFTNLYISSTRGMRSNDTSQNNLQEILRERSEESQW